MNPYSGIDDYQFWYRAVTAPPAGHIDPVVDTITINATDRVATMGSCFAQHISRNIQKFGFNYFVTEPGPADLDAAGAKSRNYGVFSARYGNVYTARQAVQLFDRAFGDFTARDNIWSKGDRFVDAFRPQIEPDGFGSKDALLQDRADHLAAVRRLFLDCDWLVFTLGLTEAWRSKRDGSILPVAPGVAGGTYDPDEFEFVNFSAGDVTADLCALTERLRRVNPGARLLLTVSPVPLIATYERRHVLVSTTFSKSALRVAADELERKYENVFYFPSYEIITCAPNSDRYFADDYRQVNDIGVAHVMRVFSKHYMGHANPSVNAASYAEMSASQMSAEIVCDEEIIASALKVAGF